MALENGTMVAAPLAELIAPAIPARVYLMYIE